MKAYSKRQFVIEHKRRGYINYCEAIILPNGKICFAEPSHLEALISIYGKERVDIFSEMPVTESPIDYLLDKTGCVAVWYNCRIYASINQKQVDTLSYLLDARVIKWN
ncbi:hypothetical protein [Eubacterium sp.]|uniref:hypothetical protein n=1 Tax=Eubacterium sp. TaxID=142586 RepID=UPI002FC84335